MKQSLISFYLAKTCEDIPHQLVGLANARGGKDNVTVVLVKVPGDSDDPEAADVLKKLDILRRIPLFRHLNYKELVKVLNQTQQKTFS